MYPEGAHELENKFEQDFGDAAMGVAYAYLFRKVRPKKQRVLYEGLASSMFTVLLCYRQLYNNFTENMTWRGAERPTNC